MNLVAAFLLGLAGSLHCAVMCGPLLLAVKAARRQNRAGQPAPAFSGEIPHSIAYHTGRLATYCLLGAISGLIGAAVVLAGFQRWLSISAGCLVLLALLVTARVRLGGLPGKLVLMAKSRFNALLKNGSLGAAALLGGLNGWLPCGLVYIACAAAAAAGTIAGGAVTMLAFGLGTAPVLLSVGLLGKVFRWSRPLGLQRVVFICAATAGILLIVRGLSLGIPYFSPQFLNGQGPSCPCHHNSVLNS